jgi:ArsR family transcriptional regulator
LQKNTYLRDRAMGSLEHLPFSSASFDVVTCNWVVEHLEAPAAVLAEVKRVLRPGGRLIIIDLASHARDDLVSKRAHRWPGFSDTGVHQLLTDAGLDPGDTPGNAPGNDMTIPGPLDVRIWCATRMHAATADASLEHVN